jgi:hypothetical protein
MFNFFTYPQKISIFYKTLHAHIEYGYVHMDFFCQNSLKFGNVHIIYIPESQGEF